MALRADDVDLGRDRALVEQYQDGDLAAFEDLYRRYYSRLFRFCLRRTGDPHEAEEVTQEAFARAFRAMPALRGERRFYPWLSVIASRLCIDSHRRLDRTEPAADVDPGSVEWGQDRLETAVDYDYLEKALARLNPRHREVLYLREGEGWSYQRIAEHYDVSIGTVEGLLFRARAALRREFLAVAGPEGAVEVGMGGRGAVLPPALGLGWLGRRLAGLRVRAHEWASGMAAMPGLAANGVGLAVVVATAAAGLSSMTGHSSRPVVVAVGAPIAATAPVPTGGTARGQDLARPPTTATAATGTPGAGTATRHHGLDTMGPGPSAEQVHRAPIGVVAPWTGVGPSPSGDNGAGVDPGRVVADTVNHAVGYAGQANDKANKETQP